MGDRVARASPRLPGTRPHILGPSDWARRIGKEIAKIAPRSSTVLVTGLAGTDKELIDRRLHVENARGEHPFVPVDFAAISGPLCASQLFGHIGGAFTGADCAALGCFRNANGVTVFLDEVGELEPPIQTTLLRVIQERSVVPVGGHEEIAVDVRIVAATIRRLNGEVREGRFRQNLYYRVKVVSLPTTPLARQESNHIARRPELTGYNQSAAARLLGIDRQVLARKMKKHGLCKPPAGGRRPPSRRRSGGPDEWRRPLSMQATAIVVVERTANQVKNGHGIRMISPYWQETLVETMRISDHFARALTASINRCLLRLRTVTL